MNIGDPLGNDDQRQSNIRRCFFVCAALLTAASINACTNTQMPPAAIATKPTDAVAFAQYFSLNGRISVRVNDRVDSGQIRWTRSPVEERIGIYSPLGSQVAELVGDAGKRVVTLRQGKETKTADSVGELTQSLLGVPLDLNRMAEWVQGVGLRENESIEATFDNGDVWRVTAERYQLSGNHRFASRVTANRDDIVVRLVIDEWVPQ